MVGGWGFVLHLASRLFQGHHNRPISNVRTACASAHRRHTCARGSVRSAAAAPIIPHQFALEKLFHVPLWRSRPCCSFTFMLLRHGWLRAGVLGCLSVCRPSLLHPLLSASSPRLMKATSTECLQEISLHWARTPTGTTDDLLTLVDV